MSDIGFDLNINNGANYKRTLSDIERILDRVDRQADKAGNIFDRFNESLRTAGLGAKIFANGLDKSAEGLQKIYEGIRGVTPQFKAFVQALEEGFRSGDLADIFGQEGQDAAEEFLGELKDTWGIASPSRVMQQYAAQLGAGFSQGTRALDLGGEGKRLATSFAQNFATTLISAVRAATVGVVEAVGGTIKAVGDRLKQGAQDLSAQGRELIQTGLQQVLVGGIAGAIQGQFVTKVADFDQILNQVKVFGDLSSKELDDVQAKILEFASRTIFDPSQSVAAFLDLQKAGLDTAQALTVLNNAGDLASAQNISLANSSNYVITAMKTFGLSVDDTKRIVDGFSAAANLSSADADDLGQALGNVGPIAKQFGLDFETTLAVISKFSDAGIQGAEAGTQLKSLLVGITRPTKETVEAFRSLGVSLTDAQGNFKPLNQVINELNKAMNETKTITVSTSHLTGAQAAQLKTAEKAYAAASRQIELYNAGLTKGALNEKTKAKALADYQAIQANASKVIADLTGDQAKAEFITKEITRTQAENFRAIQALGGSFGGIGLSVLLSGDEDAIADFVDKMKGVPTAAKIAEEQMNTFKGALESLRGSLEALGIKAIRPLLNNFLKPFLLGLTGLVNAVMLIPEPILAAVASIAGLVTAFVTLSGIFNVLSGAMMILVSGPLASLGGLLSGIGAIIMNPLGLIPAFGGLIATLVPLAALIGGLFLAFQTFSQIVQAVQTNANGAGDAFNALLTTLGKLGDTIGSIVDSGLSILSTIVEKVGQVLFGITDIDFSSVTNFFNTLNSYAQKALDFLTGVKDTLAFIAKTISGDKTTADQDKALADQKAALKEIAVLQAKASTVGSTTSKYLIKQGDSLIKIARDANTTVDELIKANGGKRFKLFAGQSINLPVTVEDQQAKDEISRLRTLALNAQDDIQTESASIVDAFSKVAGTDFFKQLFGDQNMDQVLSQLRDLEGNIRRTIDNVANSVRAFIEKIIASIRALIERGINFISGLVDLIRNSALGKLVDDFVQSLPSLFGKIVNGIIDILNVARNALQEFFLFKWLEDIGIHIELPDIGGLRDAFVNFINSFGDTLQTAITGGQLVLKIKDFIGGLFNIIQVNWFKLGVAVVKLVSNFGSWFGDTFRNVGDTVGNLARGAGDLIRRILEALWNAFKSLVTGIANFLVSAVQAAINAAGQFIEGTGLGDFVRNLIESIRNFDFKAEIGKAFKNLTTAIATGFQNAVDAARRLLDETGIAQFITTAIERLRSIDFGDLLRRLFERLARALADAFNFAVEQAQSFLDSSGIGDFITRLVDAIRKFDYIGAFRSAFKRLISGLKTAFSVAFSEISRFLKNAGITDLVAGLFDAIKNFDYVGTFGPIVEGIFSALVSAFQTGVTILGDFYEESGLKAYFDEQIARVQEFLQPFFDMLSRVFGQGVEELANTTFPAIGGIFSSLGSAIQSLFAGRPDEALQKLADVFGNLGTAILSFPVVIARTVRDFLREIGANDIADALDKTLVPALEDLRTGIGGFFDALKTINIGDLGKVAIFAAGVLALTNPITAIAAAVGVFTALGIGDALPKVGEAVAAFINSISGLLEGDSDKFLTSLSDSLTKLGDALTTIRDSANAKLGDLGFGAIADGIEKLVSNPVATGFVAIVADSLKLIGDAVTNLAKVEPLKVTSLFSMLEERLTNIGKIGGLTEAAKTITKFFESISKLPAVGNISKLFSEVSTSAQGFITSFTASLPSGVQNIINLLINLFNRLANIFSLGKIGDKLDDIGNGIVRFFAKLGEAAKNAFGTVATDLTATGGPLAGINKFFTAFQGFADKLVFVGALIGNFEALKNGIVGFIDGIKGADFTALIKLAGILLILINPLAAISAIAVDLGLALVAGALPHLGEALKSLADAADKLFKGDIAGVLGSLVDVLIRLFGALGEGFLSALDRLAKIMTDLTGLNFGKPSETIRQLLTIIGSLGSILSDALSKLFSRLADQIGLAILTALRGIIPGSQAAIDELTAKLAAGDTAQKIGDALTQQLAGAEVDLSAIKITSKPDDIAKNLSPDLAKTYVDALQKALAEGDTETTSILLPITASPFFPQAEKDRISAEIFHQIEAAVKAGNGDQVQTLIPVAAKIGVDLKGLVDYGVLSPDNIKTAILTAVRAGDRASLDALLPVAVKLNIDKDPEIVTAIGDLKTKSAEIIKNEIASQGTIAVDAGALQVQIENFATDIGVDTANLDETAKQALADQFAKKFNISAAFSKAIVDAFASGGKDALANLDFAALFAGETGNTKIADAEVFRLAGVDISQAVIDGLRSNFAAKSPEVQGAATQMAADFKQRTADEFGIHSPSQWAIDTAGYIIQGLVEGLTAALPTVQGPLVLLTSTFDTLRAGATLVMDMLVLRIIALPAQITPAIAAANAQIKTLADAWKTVAMQAADAEAAIKRAAAASSDAGVPLPSGGGGPRPPGRAGGGPVRANNWFQMADGPDPEIYTAADGRQYMLPSKNGYVSKVSNAPVGSTTNIGGDTYAPSIQINIGDNVNLSEAQIEAATQRALEADKRNNNAQRRMTHYGVR